MSQFYTDYRLASSIGSSISLIGKEREEKSDHERDGQKICKMFWRYVLSISIDDVIDRSLTA